jgi:hypothetical protein
MEATDVPVYFWVNYLFVFGIVAVLVLVASSIRDSPETECPGWRRGARPARREEGA